MTGPYKCRYCVLSFDTHQHRAQHETNGHKRHYVRKEMCDPVYYCPICNSPYMNLGATQRHTKLVHGLSSNELNQRLALTRMRETEVMKRRNSRPIQKVSQTVKEEEEAESDDSMVETAKEENAEEVPEQSSDILYESMSGIISPSASAKQTMVGAVIHEPPKTPDYQPNTSAAKAIHTTENIQKSSSNSAIGKTKVPTTSVMAKYMNCSVMANIPVGIFRQSFVATANQTFYYTVRVPYRYQSWSKMANMN